MSRVLKRRCRGAIVGGVARVAALSGAGAAVGGPEAAASSFRLVGSGGGTGGLSGSAIWSATWWNGSPQGPGPVIGPPEGGGPVCIWHDLGPGLANLAAGLSEASLPLSFWQQPDGGGHPGIWGVDEWASGLLSRAKATDHFDLVACPDGAQVPPTSGDVEADLPRAFPPLGPPLYVWLFFDTVPDPPTGRLPGIVGRAFDEAALPKPIIGTSPSVVGGIPDSTVVNVATWLWVDPESWHTYRATASGGGYVATVWADPVSVTWTAAWDFSSPAEDPEGGITFAPEVLDEVCDGPGVLYDQANASQQPACAFDFTQSSFGTRQRLTASVTWEVWWALSSPTGIVGGEGSLGLAHLRASEGLRVLQVESVIRSW